MKPLKRRKQLQRKREIVEELTTQIESVQLEMATAMDNFSSTVEPALLDYYTYQYKANEIKHGYLLRQLKKVYYTPTELEGREL